MDVFSVPKPLVGGFGCDELVLYGIRELAQQFLGSVLDIEVDHSDSCLSLCLYVIMEPCNRPFLCMKATTMP